MSSSERFTRFCNRYFTYRTKYQTKNETMDIVSNPITKNDIPKLIHIIKTKASSKQRLVLQIDFRDLKDDECFLPFAHALCVTETKLTTLFLLIKSCTANLTSTIAEGLKAHSGLTKLTIHVESTTILAIIEACQSMSSLTELELFRRKIRTEEATALAESICLNHSLNVINLYIAIDNDLGDDETTLISDALVIVNAIGRSMTLKTFNFAVGRVPLELCDALAMMLNMNATLTTLDLAHNWIAEPQDITSLAKALRVNTSLSTLDLTGLSIGDIGTSALAEALRVNTTLTSLNLSHNNIGTEGIHALADVLQVQLVGLTKLYLSNNIIGDNDTITLARALQVNTLLTLVDLQFNPIHEDGAIAVAEALRFNPTLKILYLHGCFIAKHGWDALESAIEYKIDTQPHLERLLSKLICIEGGSALAIAYRMKFSSLLTVKDVA